jgi:hypothetical protein
MADILISPSEVDPNFHGYFRFGYSRYGIFFKCEDDEYNFNVVEMFLKTELFDRNVEDIDSKIAGCIISYCLICLFYEKCN